MTSTEGKVIEVLDSGEPLEFVGVLLSSVSTQNDDSVRWTSMDLYRITDGENSGRYLLHIEGRSNVYHGHKSRCNAGVPVDVDDLDDEVFDAIVPCYKCRPPEPDDIPQGVKVDLEENRYTNHLCPNPTVVIARLRDARSGAGGAISGPGQRLLAMAARDDEAVMAALKTPRRL